MLEDVQVLLQFWRICLDDFAIFWPIQEVKNARFHHEALELAQIVGRLLCRSGRWLWFGEDRLFSECLIDALTFECADQTVKIILGLLVNEESEAAALGLLLPLRRRELR